MVYDQWSGMLPDLLEAISDRLPLREFVAFRGVCRRWRSAPSGRSGITNFSKDTPWLMFYGGFHRKEASDRDTACYLYGSPNPNCCVLRLPHLRGATVMQSMSDWLFVRRDSDGHFFLYNPLTLTKINLPDHRVYEDQVCAMSSTTDHGSSAFIVSRKDGSTVEVSLCRIGDSEWKSHAVQMSKDKYGTLSAVYEREDGSLAIFGDGKAVLVYNCTTKTSVATSRVPTTKKSREEAELILQLWEDTCGHKNWLQMMFGEGEEDGGIEISTCPLNMRLPGVRGVGPRTRVVTRDQHDGSSNAQLIKLVKAAWIEPDFI